MQPARLARRRVGIGGRAAVSGNGVDGHFIDMAVEVTAFLAAAEVAVRGLDVLRFERELVEPPDRFAIHIHSAVLPDSTTLISTILPVGTGLSAMTT